ncbi:MAG TPA: beta-propeller fold lactonase family protein [Lacunisphaera sp.]|nr:beta-propeller fold lactonase family protein [Lacunisphaera sp.]
MHILRPSVIVAFASFVLSAGLVAASAATAAGSGALLVANKGNHSVSIVDPVTGQETGNIGEEAITGHELVATADGKSAFVPIYGNSGVGQPGTDGSLIRVLDLERKAISGTIDLGHGTRPHCAVFGPHDRLLYVTTELDETVTIIDPQTLKIVGTIPTGQPESHMLAISHDGHRGYTANVGPGTISILDLDKKALVTTVKLAPTIQRIAISADDRWVFTADQSTPRLVVLAAADNSIGASIELPGEAYGTAATPDGRSLIVAMPSINQVGLVDLGTMKLVKSMAVPRAPQEVLVEPKGATAYVSCDHSGEVVAIDIAGWRLDKHIKVGPGADGLAWAR